MPRRVLILANPIAGGGRARTVAPELARALHQHGCTAELYFTQRAGDAGARAATAGTEPWDALCAVGGDGTINEVLNGMPDVARPLAVLPVGTANVLACEFGLPRQPADVAAAIAGGRCRPHAIGLCGPRRFLLFCGAGIDGAVVERLHQVRTGTLGKHKWFVPIAQVLRHWPQFVLRAELDSGEVLDDLSSVLVTRVRNYGGWLRLTPDVDAGDGKLHVLCFRQRRRRAWLWLGVRGLLRGLRPSRQLIVRTTTGVRIAGCAPFQIDGDLGGRTPVVVSLLPVAANLVVPC